MPMGNELTGIPMNSGMNGYHDPKKSKKLEWDHSRRAKSIKINDVIHGNIKVYHPLQMILDTKEFHRLRHIKQLGIAYLVFPSGDYSRFTHSLGVYHLALQHVKILSEVQPELEISSTDIMCVAMAGLMHDLGHGPFSHMFEHVLDRANPGHGFKHEHGSILIFEHMLDHNPKLREELDLYLSDVDYIFIKELIDPPKSFLDKDNIWQLKGRPIEKSFLYDIVSNVHDSIDVDKIDYILRDSKLARIGVEFNFDALERIQDDFEAREYENYKRIVYAEKIRSDVNKIMSSRRSLHESLYQHKTSVGIETMMVSALSKAAPFLQFKGGDGKYYDLGHAFQDMTAYLKLDDSIVQQILHSEDPRLDEAKAILEQIEGRQLLRCVGTTFITSHPEVLKSSHEIKDQILKKDPSLDKDMVIVATRQIHRGKFNIDPINEVLFYNKHDDDEEAELEPPTEKWIGTNTYEKTVKNNIYVYVPYNTPIDARRRVFLALKKAAKVHKWDTPTKVYLFDEK